MLNSGLTPRKIDYFTCLWGTTGRGCAAGGLMRIAPCLSARTTALGSVSSLRSRQKCLPEGLLGGSWDFVGSP